MSISGYSQMISKLAQLVTYPFKVRWIVFIPGVVNGSSNSLALNVLFSQLVKV
jgi:hypothetical protein